MYGPVDSIFTLIKARSIYRQQVGWDTLQGQFEQYRDTAANPFTAFRWLFRQMGDHHSSVRYRNRGYRNARPRPVGQEEEFAYLASHESYNKFEVKQLENTYGYLLIPTVFGEDAEVKELIAAIRDSLCAKINKPVKGWIVDLRTNGGGNTFPMIAVLDFLLPEGPFGTVRGPDGEKIETWLLKAGDAYIDKERVTVNGKSCMKKDLVTPVALLTSPFTVSAGEMVVASFAGRRNAISIGDTTGGLVTSNETIQVDEETVLILNTGYVADRTGKLYKTAIPPDILLPDGYNFENLSADKHVQAAIHWLNTQVKGRQAKDK